MNIYNAIMKAADHIERYPQEFDFHSCQIPDGPGCGTPGCALGWIGFYSGTDLRAGLCGMARVSTDFLGIKGDDQFYKRMNKLCKDTNWIDSPSLCAAGLRLYAEKYHAADKQPRQEVVPWSAVVWRPRVTA